MCLYEACILLVNATFGEVDIFAFMTIWGKQAEHDAL